MNRENLQGKLRENSGRENSGGTIQLKKRKIHVDKIGNGKYNILGEILKRLKRRPC